MNIHIVHYQRKLAGFTLSTVYFKKITEILLYIRIFLIGQAEY